MSRRARHLIESPQKSLSLAYCVGAKRDLSNLMIHSGAAEIATMSATFQIKVTDKTKDRSLRGVVNQGQPDDQQTQVRLRSRNAPKYSGRNKIDTT